MTANAAGAVTAVLVSRLPSSEQLICDEKVAVAAASHASAATAALSTVWQSTRPAARSLTSDSHSSSSNVPALTPSASSASAAVRCARVLESGHVFVRHTLSARSVLTDRVVLFVLSGVLYACKHTRHQSRYKQPFLSLPLASASQERPLVVYMGKQTTALRLVPNTATPERRCFSLQLADVTLELEAPGSGDVRYWLRSLYELLTRSYQLSTAGRSLVFLPPSPPTAETVERTERRMRQLRMDGQRARRREEADRRLNGEQRIAEEKARDELTRERQCDELREQWMSAQSEVEERVTAAAASAAAASTCAVLSPSRALVEDLDRLDGDRRIREAFERDADVEVQRRRLTAVHPPLHVPALASEYAKHNQRCAELQTHTRAPLIAHTVQAGRRLGSSQSSPNLACSALEPSLSPALTSAGVAPPTAAARSISGSSLGSPSPAQRRLPSLRPNSLSSQPSSPRSSHSIGSQPSNAGDTPRSTSSSAAPAGQLAASTPSSVSPSSTSSVPLVSRPPVSLAPTPTASCTAGSPSSFYSSLSSHTTTDRPSLCRGSGALTLFPSLGFDSSLPSLEPFSPLSPNSSRSLSYGDFMFSPARSLPVTTVYSVRTAAATLPNHPTAQLHSHSAISPAAKSAGPVPEPLVVLPSPLIDASGTAASSLMSPTSFRFHCAIQLPELASPPSHSGGHSVGGIHFHFHTATSPPPPSSSFTSNARDNSDAAAAGYPLQPPPPYTAQYVL